jgi:hypothetical protein
MTITIINDSPYEVEAGNILHTTNGDFLIVSIESFSKKNNNNQKLCGYGAIYLDDENEYPTEMQFINSDLDRLIESICDNNNHKILSVSKFTYKK